LTVATEPVVADPEGMEAIADPDDCHLDLHRHVPTGAVPIQLGANIAELRHDAGLSGLDLAERSGVVQSRIAGFEAGRHAPSLLVALRLAGSMGVSIDRLTLGVFWNPGEVATCDLWRPRPERLDGYFSTRPPHLGDDSPRVPVTDQSEVAEIIGRNLRDARRRRRLPQHALGLKQTHVSRIERGLIEPALGTLIGLARELEIPIEALLAGMCWGGPGRHSAGASPVGRPGRRRDPRALDAAITRGCRAGRGTSGIARDLAVDGSVVRRVVARLRREGRSLAADPGLWTPVDIEDELALRHEEGTRAGEAVGEEEARAVIGRTLRAERRRAEISQERLAEAAGFRNGHSLSQVERRGPNFAITHLIRIASSLRVPCSTLTRGLRWDPGIGSFLLARHVRRDDVLPATLIGRNARRIRQAAGLSEATLAGRVGRRGRYFNALERGGKLPRPVTVLMLACALEVETGALLDGVRDWYVRPLLPLAIPEAEEAVESASRQDRLLHMWEQGRRLRDIGEAVDMKPTTVFGVVDRLREIGVDVVYRKAPSNPAQLSTRLRRRRAGRPAIVG